MNSQSISERRIKQKTHLRDLGLKSPDNDVITHPKKEQPHTKIIFEDLLPSFDIEMRITKNNRMPTTDCSATPPLP